MTPGPALATLLLAANFLAGPLPAAAHGAHSGHAAGAAQPMVAGRPVESLLLPDTPMTDAKGTIQGLTDRYGAAGPLLIAFSYTGCVSLCPVTHAILSAVDEALGRPGAPRLHIVTISIDPVNDTPDRLAAAAREIGASDRWDWLVATPESTPLLLGAFGIPSGPPEAHDPVFLLGDMETGDFRRIVGLPDPGDLLALAAAGS